MMSRFLDNNRLRSKDFRVSLTIEDLEFERGFRGICHDESAGLSFPGWAATVSTQGIAENVTEDQ
jgi:hypothetical protein